jgi:type I restriction enzyme, S subunit
VRPKSVGPEWLNEITGSLYAQSYFITHSKQSTNLASISSTNIMELPVVLPPAVDGDEILAFIDEQRDRLDALTAESYRAIALLQERRTALISAAVTGKIDVRGVATSETAA